MCMSKLLAIIFLFSFSSLHAQKDWKLSIQLWTFHQYSFYQAIEKADTLGLKYVEAYPGQKIGPGIPGNFSYTLSKPDRDILKKYLLDKNIKVVALGVVDREYYNSGNLEKFFEFAKYMGITFLTAEPEWADLNEFNRLAEKYKVKVGLHCHPRPSSHYWNPDSLLYAMRGRKNIGAWPDVAHWTRSGVDAVKALKKMQGKLWGLHFKDVVSFNDTKARDTLFGKGAVNLSAVITELKRQKFKGVISMEYEANDLNNMQDMIFNKKYFETEVKKLH